MAYTRFYTTWKNDPDITTPAVAAFYQALEDFLVTVTPGIAPPASPATNDALLYSGTAWTNGKITNANVDPAAAITYGKLALANSIVNGDINSAAAIAYSKLALAASIVNGDISASAAIAYSKLALSGSIVNTDIASAAAIAYSKLSLAGSVVNADISTSAAIAYAKLSLTNSIVNADINSAAAIAYSKLSLSGSIVNGDIASSAAIAISKLADPGAGNVITSIGAGAVAQKPPAYEWAYAQVTAGASVAVAAEASAQTLFTLPAATFDGSPVMVDFFCPLAQPSGGVISSLFVTLWESTTQISRLAAMGNEVATGNNLADSLAGQLRFTPSAASHTYIVKAFAVTGTWTVNAGTGSGAAYPPMFCRITKV